MLTFFFFCLQNEQLFYFNKKNDEPLLVEYQNENDILKIQYSYLGDELVVKYFNNIVFNIIFCRDMVLNDSDQHSK
jgi:hypothetical protein